MSADKSIEFRDYAAREVADLAERLTKAAAAAAERAAAAAADQGRQALEALQAEMQAALKKTAEDGQKVAETLRGELQNTVKQKTALANSLKETQTHLEKAREELDARQSELESVHGELASARGELESVHGELAVARAELQSAQDELGTARGELKTSHDDLASVRRNLQLAHGELTSVRGDLDSAQGALATTQADVEVLRGMLASTEGELQATRDELHATVERGDTIGRQLADARQAIEQLEAVRDDLTLARDEEARAKAAAEADARKTRESFEITTAALSAAESQLATAAGDRAALEETLSIAHSQIEAADAKLVAVTDLFNKSAARVKILERAQQDHERTVEELEARIKTPAAAAAAPGPVPLFDDLLAGFQALESAATMNDVLTTFVEQLAAQFARIALFRVRKSHLQGEHQIGFDLATDIGKVVLPLGMDSLPARAASSGLIERLSGDDLKDGAGAPFSGSPRFALAIPIVAGGDTLAIVYADDAGGKHRRGGDQSPVAARFAEALQHHAVALLMRMSNELKARAELQAYAQSLLHELEQMYAADQQNGKQGDELQARLEGNLDYARSIFDSRVALEGSGASELLDDEIGALLESAPDTPFAQHLAAVSGRAVQKRNTAEAS